MRTSFAGSGLGHPDWDRSGVTLAEVTVSLIVSTVLMSGLSSALYVIQKASSPSASPARGVLAGSDLMMQLANDLQFALTMPEKGSLACTITVPDRNQDASPETIRYVWSGTPGAPITFQYNNGPVSTLLENVYAFSLSYVQPAASVQYVRIVLQAGASSQSRIETSVLLFNRP